VIDGLNGQEEALAIANCLNGEGSVRDVITVTEFIRSSASKFLDTNDELDAEMLEHITFASNQILQNVRRDGLEKDAIEKCGKILLRLVMVWREYYKNKHGKPLSMWTKEIELILEAIRMITTK